MRSRVEWCVLGLLLSMATPMANAACKIAQIADLPVTMRGLQPLINVTINGKPSHFVIDSGAFMSMISPEKAEEYQLPLRHDAYHPGGVVGVGGGTTDLHLTQVDEFGFGGLTVHKAQFVVGGNEYGYDVAGLLGQNLWGNFDVEYDLANGHIRLMRPVDCGDQPLAYWTVQSGEVPSMLPILSSKQYGHTIGKAEVNGRTIYAYFDTGAGGSILSLPVAFDLGIKLTNHNVRPGGAHYGVAGGYVNSWIAPIASFKIGGEEIRNTQIRIGDAGGSDMLLGSDFFLSHRI
jgi:predicted aspartyl protease